MKKAYHFKGDAMQPEMRITYRAIARQKLNKIKRILLKYITDGNSDN
jgi:hypothetical protein